MNPYENLPPIRAFVMKETRRRRCKLIIPRLCGNLHCYYRSILDEYAETMDTAIMAQILVVAPHPDYTSPFNYLKVRLRRASDGSISLMRIDLDHINERGQCVGGLSYCIFAAGDAPEKRTHAQKVIDLVNSLLEKQTPLVSGGV